MNKKKIYIVTEGGHDIGLGHISRCLSFYDRFLEEGYEVRLLIDGGTLCDQLLWGKKYRYLSWHQNIHLLSFTKGNIIFLDSITATQDQVDYFQLLTPYFLVIDDYKRRNYAHALIIDWTPNVEHSNKHLHNVQFGNTLLLGIGYSVLRPAFVEEANYEYRVFSNVTVIMGGSDIRNLTPLLSNLLGALETSWHINVILGPGTTDFVPVTPNIFIYHSLDALKMREVFLASDLVISAGGQTLFELASLRVPTLPIQVIDNQREDVQGLLKLGFYDEFFQWNDPELLEKLVIKIKTLIPVQKRKDYMSSFKVYDVGRGMDKIIRAIYDYCHESI